MTRSRDVADTQDNLGGAVAPYVAGKNAAFNSGMDIAQRGTAAVTLTAANFVYPVDRFFAGRSAGTTGATAQQFTSTSLDGFQYGVRVQRTASDTSTNDLYIGQSFETANSIPFANKAVVVSFYARKGADYSPTASALGVRFYTGTGTDQSGLGSGFTGSATPISQTATLTTDWKRFQYTVTLASTAKQMQFLVFCTPTGTAAAADYFDITGLQVEQGAVATPFARAGGSIGGELALCQRYYQKSYPIEIAPGAFFLGGYSLAIIQSNVPDGVYYNYQRLITRMRVAPTVIVYSGSGALNRMSTVSASDFPANSALTNSISDNGFGITNNSGTTLTFSSGGYLFYYTASAEL
jgi:hypothetical protein